MSPNIDGDVYDQIAAMHALAARQREWAASGFIKPGGTEAKLFLQAAQLNDQVAQMIERLSQSPFIQRWPRNAH